ncbi:MAG: FAD-binding protein [Planctomycetota bacterium]
MTPPIFAEESVNWSKKNRLIGFLEASTIPFELDAPLNKYCWLPSSAVCACAVTPTSIIALASVLEYCNNQGIFYKVLGNTSNCFFPANERYGCFIFTNRLNAITIDWIAQEVRAECGASLSSLALKTAKHGIAGFAGMVGIPGTVGGAVVMNAGSYGDSIGDTLDRIEFLDQHNRRITLRASELNLGYRSSALRDGVLSGAVLQAVFRLVRDDDAVLGRKLAAARTLRATTQEKRLPNLGSLFATKFLYEDIAKHHPAYWVILRLYFWVFYRVARWVFRWTPPPSYLNRLTLFWFGKSFSPQPFSDFTMNCYVYRVDDDTVFFEYINWIKVLTHNTVVLENEIVREPRSL